MLFQSFYACREKTARLANLSEMASSSNSAGRRSAAIYNKRTNVLVRILTRPGSAIAQANHQKSQTHFGLITGGLQSPRCSARRTR